MTIPDPDTIPRPRSAAQIEASRNNGARSKGPATPEGKAASSHNATKHGLRAAGFALLPDEDEDAFEALRQRLVEEHDPRGAVEEALVEGLALALWRMRRVEALEVEALSEARERRPSAVYAGGYNPHSPALWAPERMNTILRYRAGLERGLHRTLKALAERRAARAAEENDTNEPGPPAPEARFEPAADPGTNQPEAAAAPPEPAGAAAHERTRAETDLAAKLAPWKRCLLATGSAAQSPGALKVSHRAISPPSSPALNHLTRWADEPWVKLSGVT